VRRKSRLFALAEYLRGRRTGVTAEALAERFGVTVRTIYRDLDALRDAQLPVAAERGRGGGYALDRGYTLPPVNFTPREAAVLATVGRWAEELRLVPFTDTLDAALDKVRGALDQAAQRELARHMERLRFVGVPAPKVPVEVRRAVEQAWFEQRPLRVTYRTSAGEVERRTVRIVGALLERGMTLLECEEDGRPTARPLRLQRIEAAELVPHLAREGRRQT
jgi:predicted DNA-binding transcriptional regulator YafY